MFLPLVMMVTITITSNTVGVKHLAARVSVCSLFFGVIAVFSVTSKCVALSRWRFFENDSVLVERLIWTFYRCLANHFVLSSRSCGVDERICQMAFH